MIQYSSFTFTKHPFNEPLNLFSANDLISSGFRSHSAQLLPENTSMNSGISLIMKKGSLSDLDNKR